MTSNKPTWAKIEQRLTAEPISSGGWTIQPVARLSGWQWGGEGQKADYTGALVRIRPLEIIVRQDGAERTIPIFDPVSNTVRAIMLIALAVSIFCAFVMFVAQRIAKRR